jgi:uncharacterized membrane protein YgdD (TMEM256/DUF423 family)
VRAKDFLVLGGIGAGSAVILGAFAAHTLKKTIPVEMLEAFTTGVHYQLIHSVALILCGLLLNQEAISDTQKYFARAAICFIIGIFCFSGSLYGLALTDSKWLGPVTPIGGTLFVVGWGMFVFASLKINEVSP